MPSVHRVHAPPSYSLEYRLNHCEHLNGQDPLTLLGFDGRIVAALLPRSCQRCRPTRRLGVYRALVTLLES
jgi:hypothetical protein